MRFNVQIPDNLRSRLAEPRLDFLVIGGGGWIGRAVLDVLASTLGRRTFEERVRVLGSSTRRISIAPGWEVDCLALERWRELAPRRSLVFHNGFLTREKVAQLPEQTYIATNRAISDHVAALCTAWEPEGLFLPSSGAAYSADGGLERDLGLNPYGALKVEDEQRFSSLLAGRAAYVAPRIFGLSGEYINKTASYALADLILQLKRTQQISLRAEGSVYRSYVYVGDLIALSLEIMLDGARPHETFDTAGAKIVEVGELADRICILLGHPNAPIHRQWREGVRADRYVGDFNRMAALAERHEVPLLPLDEQIIRTAEFLSGDVH